MSAVLQSFPVSGKWSRMSVVVVTLAAVNGVALLFFHYRIISTSSGSPSLEPRSRQHASNVSVMHNYSFGLIWPSNDVNVTDDRVASQIDFMNVYARQNYQNRRLKVILRVGNFNFRDWVAGQEQFVRDRCPITSCWMTNNQTRARDADALLISEFSRRTRHLYMPKPPRQVWIAQLWESPLHNRIDPNSVRGLINWTASYRHDATIVLPYRKMAPNTTTTVAVTSGESSINYAAGKTKLVAWFVSNCHSSNQRMRYAQELSRFIQVWSNVVHSFIHLFWLRQLGP